MIDFIKEWFQRQFSNPQVVILALLLIIGFSIIVFLGDILLPLLAAIVIAYMLEAIVVRLERRGMGRKLASITVFSIFMLVVIAGLLVATPLLVEQISQFISELPKMVGRLQKVLLQLPESYPGLVTPAQINDLMGAVSAELGKFGQAVLTYSLASLQGIVTWSVYLILISLLIFFFLKDKEIIKEWIRGYTTKTCAGFAGLE